MMLYDKQAFNTSISAKAMGSRGAASFEPQDPRPPGSGREGGRGRRSFDGMGHGKPWALGRSPSLPVALRDLLSEFGRARADRTYGLAEARGAAPPSPPPLPLLPRLLCPSRRMNIELTTLQSPRNFLSVVAPLPHPNPSHTNTASVGCPQGLGRGAVAASRRRRSGRRRDGCRGRPQCPCRGEGRPGANPGGSGSNGSPAVYPDAPSGGLFWCVHPPCAPVSICHWVPKPAEAGRPAAAVRQEGGPDAEEVSGYQPFPPKEFPHTSGLGAPVAVGAHQPRLCGSGLGRPPPSPSGE